MKRLTSYLRLAAPLAPETSEILRKAEAIAPGTVKAHGALLDNINAGRTSLYDVVIDRILTSEQREEYERASHALSETTLQFNSKHEDAGTVACDAYTPQITSAYYLGLAIGWHVAQTIGGAK